MNTHTNPKNQISLVGVIIIMYTKDSMNLTTKSVCLLSFICLSKMMIWFLSSMLSISYARILRLNNLQISLLDFHTIWLPDLDILCASSKSLRNLTIKSLFSFSYDTLFFMNFWKPNGFLVYDSFKHQFRFGPSMTQYYPVQQNFYLNVPLGIKDCGATENKPNPGVGGILQSNRA